VIDWFGWCFTPSINPIPTCILTHSCGYKLLFLELSIVLIGLLLTMYHRLRRGGGAILVELILCLGTELYFYKLFLLGLVETLSMDYGLGIG
jgi:hypothetical protein